MNARRWLSHGIALLLGAAIAASLASNKQGEVIPAVGAEANLNGHRVCAVHVRPSPPELLAALAGTPMAMARHLAMKNEIYADWAQRDPAGLLAYLKNRAWPVHGSHGFDRVFIELSRQQPGVLPAYARANGCREAMEAIVHGDPRVAFPILLAEKPGRIPYGLMHDLFEKGEGSDPEFHQRIAGIADPAARADAISGTARVMLENRRFDDFFSLLDREKDWLNPERIGAGFASAMIKCRSAGDLNRMVSMADNVRSVAVKELLDYVSQDSVAFGPRLYEVDGVETLGRSLGVNQYYISEEYRLGTLRILTEHGWLAGLEHHAAAAITGEGLGLCNANEELAAQWKQWALDLPEAENMKMVREAAIVRWIKLDPEKNAEIAGLPTQRLRDISYVAAVSSMDGWHLAINADDVRKLVGRIADPELREQAAQALEKRIAGKQK